VREVCAQTAQPSAKTPTIESIRVAAKKLKNNRRFQVHYDKFKDISRVTVGPFNIGSTGAYILTNAATGLSAGFAFKGDSLTEPVRDYFITLESSGNNSRFFNEQDFYAIVDGERLALGRGVRDSDIGRGVFNRGRVLENIIWIVPSDTFEQIANAKNLEFKVATFEATLKEEHMQAFRDLVTLSDAP
jgi:hypothetical protein